MGLEWANNFEKAMLQGIDIHDYSFAEAKGVKMLMTNTLSMNEHLNVGKNGYGITYSSGVTVDSSNKYSLNSLGYRSPEFDGQDFLFAGCSQSFGVGVPEDAIWGVQLARLLNSNYYNLSFPGVSVQWIVQKLFAYFKQYGNPKVLACLFPDFFRMSIGLNRNLLYKHRSLETFHQVTEVHLLNDTDLSNRPKYSKRPHIAVDVLPPEMPFYLSCQYIHMLEQYCRSNGIKFFWSVWRQGDGEIIKKYKDTFAIFDNHISIDENRWCDLADKEILLKNIADAESFNIFGDKETCHEELREEYSHCFDKGSDVEDPKSNRHMGVHKHTHVAEEFYRSFKEGIS